MNDYQYSYAQLKEISVLEDGQSLIFNDKKCRFSITCIVSDKLKCDKCEFYHHSDEDTCQHIDCSKPNRIFVKSILYNEQLIKRPWLKKR